MGSRAAEKARRAAQSALLAEHKALRATPNGSLAAPRPRCTAPFPPDLHLPERGAAAYTACMPLWRCPFALR